MAATHTINLSTYSTAEMIATVMDSAINNRTFQGVFGSVSAAVGKGSGFWQVDLNDNRGTFYARHLNGHWTVERNGLVGVDADLYTAAAAIINL